MKELSLNLLDIAQNSVSAGARNITIGLVQVGQLLTITVADDGCGMAPDLLARVTDPFATTRTTRKVGLGIPLLKLACEQTGGSFCITSMAGVGTAVVASFYLSHIDCPPLGDMAGTLSSLVQGAPDLDVTFSHETPQGAFRFDTKDMRRELGPDAPLSLPEVAIWMKEYIAQGEAALAEGSN